MEKTHPLWTPLQAGGLRLPSRLVLPPMASQTADENGFVTAATLRHYDRIVTPRHGLAFVEYSYVHPWGKSEPNQLRAMPDHQEGLAQLARLIREKGVVPGIQLTHAGGKSSEALIGRQPVGASAVPVPAYGGDLPAPEPLTEGELEELFAAFVAAALSAEEAGFQVIEIHAAHGYFFNQWLSPVTNLRQASLAMRSWLLISLIRELRARLKPQTLLSVRFPAQDRLPEGLSLADGQQLARWLEKAGLSLLNVSSGLGGWRRGREQRGEGYLVDDAAAIRQAVGIPVIGVGGIHTLAYVRQVLDEGQVDLVAVGRAILDNPAWPEVA